MSRLNEIKSELEKVLKRFPLVLISAFAAICIVLVVIGNARYTWDNNYWLTLAFALYLGIPLHFSAVVAIESRDLDKRKRLLTLLIGVFLHALIITHLVLTRNEPEFRRFSVFTFYFISCHLLSSFLPFLVGMKKEFFWHFNQWMFSRFIISSVFSFILAAGLGLAFGAMQLLFGHIHEEFIGQVVFFAATSLHVLYFFAGTPEELNNGNWIVEPSKSFRILLQYIFVPLIVLYLTILYIYLAKILFLFELPKGNVSIWILVFCTIGILTILLAEPFRKMESNWVGKLAKVFYWLMLPLLVMLWIAIFTRVLQYGLTESRGLVLYLAIWLTFISLYNGFYKRRSLLAFPISLFIITVLYQWGGPLSAHALSFNSQSKRTEEIMSRDKIDYEELRSQLYYMYNNQYDHTEWFEANQLPLKKQNDFWGSYELVSEILDSDRFRNKLIKPTSDNEDALASEVTTAYVYLNQIDIQGYNELYFLTRGSKAYLYEWTVTFSDNGKEISRDFKNEFNAFCKSLDRQAVNQPPFIYDWTEDGKQFRLILTDYNYSIDLKNPNSAQDGVLLIR